MKNLSLIVVLIVCSFWITNCANSSTEITKTNSTNNINQTNKEVSVTESAQVTPTKKAAVSKNSEKSTTIQPTIGTVKELVNGDLLCYVTLIDESGTEHNVGASFEICEKPQTFLNKKVRASYTIESVSDCESAEPCGKTKKESIITKMEVLSQ